MHAHTHRNLKQCILKKGKLDKPVQLWGQKLDFSQFILHSDLTLETCIYFTSKKPEILESVPQQLKVK